MRCQDAKLALAAQHDSDLAESELPDARELREHLKECAACRAYEQRQHYLDCWLRTGLNQPLPFYVHCCVSTERIMQAVERQRRITQELEDLRLQQRSREARLRVLGLVLVAVAVLAVIGSLLALGIAALFQPDLMVRALGLLDGVVAALIVLAEYLQPLLLLVTRNNWLLSGAAFVLVVMMGMWLRLMRHPQEA